MRAFRSSREEVSVDVSTRLGLGSHIPEKKRAQGWVEREKKNGENKKKEIIPEKKLREKSLVDGAIPKGEAILSRPEHK